MPDPGTKQGSQPPGTDAGPGRARIARVFPRLTNVTPHDDLAFLSGPPLFRVDCDEVHVSVAFTWDIAQAEFLADEWRSQGYPVKIGGPACDDRGAEFVPGRYMAPGNIITSRGCPRSCWFCSVPKREGVLRELPIYEGWKIHDSNLLACTDAHVRAVFDMLSRQKHRPIFVGGLEAAIIQDWHIQALREVRTERMYFAYDTPSDYGPLVDAGRRLQEAGFTRTHHLYCYVLIGYRGDTQAAAEHRLRQAWVAGFMPYAMLYRDATGKLPGRDWCAFQREWLRPAIVRSNAGRGAV
jgi:hypothetical protein